MYSFAFTKEILKWKLFVQWLKQKFEGSIIYHYLPYRKKEMKKSYSVSFSFNSRDNKSTVCLLTVIAVKFINNTVCCCCCYCCYSVVIFRGLQNNLSDMFSIRSSHRRCFTRKVFFKISKKLSVKTSARASFLIKLQGLQLYLKSVFL